MITGRTKTILLLILAPLAIYLGVLNLADRADWKQPYDGLTLRQSADGVEVTSVTTPLASMGIDQGDLLIDINGLAINDLDGYTEVVEVLARTSPTGSVADYTFRACFRGIS